MEFIVRTPGEWYKQVDIIIESSKIEGPLLDREEAHELAEKLMDAAVELEKWPMQPPEAKPE